MEMKYDVDGPSLLNENVLMSVMLSLEVCWMRYEMIKRIYDGVEAETRKFQASFHIFQVLSEALPRIILE